MSIRPGSPPRESPDAPDTLGSPAALGSSAPAAVGLLLAAGAGRRMGGPKGLLRDADGTPWVARAAGALRDGGCEPVIVIVGAAASEVAALVPAWAHVVPAPDWADGMGASVRAGLASAEHSSGPGRAELSGTAAELAVVTLVDLPGVDAAVVARLLDRCPPGAPDAAHALVRAGYDGVPGHPVVLGRAHWADVAESAHGDAGARDYLREREVTLVECGDLAHGDDVDEPGHFGGPREEPLDGPGSPKSAARR